MNRNRAEIAASRVVAHIVEEIDNAKATSHHGAADHFARTTPTVENVHRDLADVFAIQSEVAEQIVENPGPSYHLRKGGGDRRPTADVVAYELYVQTKTPAPRPC